MTRTLQDLYLSRCTTDSSGQPKPHFWQPMRFSKRPLCLLADESKLIEDDKAELCMQRLIALGLELEIDVGKFVLEQTQGEIPNAPYVKELLKSAVADEARHEVGFKYAAEQYGTADTGEAAMLRDKWVAMADKYQPLAIAGALEQEVFLVTLGLMRVIGGASLNDLAIRIAEDESRHVATNRAITKWLGVSFGKDVTELVDETLAFAVAGLDLRITDKLRLNYDFCVKSSRELRSTGRARALDRLTRIAVHRMPFEISNRALYSSRVTEDGQSVY